MKELIIIDAAALGALTSQARQNPRLRQNLNLHADYADPCQRLFNAVEPASYIRPHRHADPFKPECFVAVRGRFALLLFDDDGGVTDWIELAPDGPVVAIDLPAGAWHTIVALEQGSIFFETKPGPYVALSDKDFAPWAPAEGSAEAEKYLKEVMSAESKALSAG